MKVIITGATGFVGRNLAERFVKDGFHVVGVGRSPAAGDVLLEQGVVFRKADIRDAPQILEAFSAAHCVIHCAGKSGPWGRYRDFYHTNVIGTRNVVAACRHHNIEKLIFFPRPVSTIQAKVVIIFPRTTPFQNDRHPITDEAN